MTLTEQQKEEDLPRPDPICKCGHLKSQHKLKVHYCWRGFWKPCECKRFEEEKK